jgi:hypothetical protein
MIASAYGADDVKACDRIDRRLGSSEGADSPREVQVAAVHREQGVSVPHAASIVPWKVTSIGSMKARPDCMPI